MTSPTTLGCRKVMGLLLTFVFVLSFLPYLTVINTGTLLVGPAAIILLAVVVLPFVCSAEAPRAFSSLTRYRFLVLALLIPLLPTIMAAGDREWSAVYYALLIALVLLSAQVLLAALSLEDVIRAFARAGTVCVIGFGATSWVLIVHSATAARRLIPIVAQPNAIAFMFVGFIAAIAWRLFDRALRPTVRGVYVVTILAAAAVIFLASSRASMLALVMATLWVLSLRGIRSLRYRRARLGVLVLSALSMVVTCSMLLLLDATLRSRLVNYVSQFLQLNSAYRGFGTGFSGRTERWAITLHALAHNALWLFGSGYRTSGTELGFSIDNGYLTIWYETGLIGLLWITGQCIWVLWMSARRYLKTVDPVDPGVVGYLLAVSGIIVVLLVNNMFDRFLFGLGNPFSMMSLFFLLVSRRDLSVNIA